MDPMDTPRTTSARWLDLAAIGLPLALISAGGMIYCVWPDVYLKYILMPTMREYQAVEIITFACAVSAGLVAAVAYRKIFRGRPAAGNAVRRLGPSLIVMSVCTSSLFLGGEEVNWGQTFTQWGTPLTDVAPETNLHIRDDTIISIQALGSVYLVGLFFVLPLLWALRKRTKLPDDPSGFSIAIPRWSVVTAAGIAFAWKQFKEIYLLVVGKNEARSSVFYNQFVEQLNEQKEMLFAVALLMLSIQFMVHLKQQTTPASDK